MDRSLRASHVGKIASVGILKYRPSITFECKRHSGHPQKVGGTVTISFSGSARHRLNSSPLISGSLFTIHPFISATKFTTRCGNQNQRIRISRKIITQSAKMQQHHQSTTTKIQVGVLRNKSCCLFVGLGLTRLIIAVTLVCSNFTSSTWLFLPQQYY